MNRILTNTILSILLISAFACEKIRQLPPEPMIEFRNFIIKDTIDELGNAIKKGELIFYFEDGDGDLGAGQAGAVSDTIEANVFLSVLQKSSGSFITPDSANWFLSDQKFRIPELERVGQNQTLMGTVELTIFYRFVNLHANDTIMYDLYIEDQAGNRSNTISTCEIWFDMEGPCIPEED